MAFKRQKIKVKPTDKGGRAGRLAGALLGVAAVAGSVMAQPSGAGQTGNREPRGRPPGGAYALPSAQQSPGKVQRASVQQPSTTDENKKLSPEEKAQLRLLLKSGQ